MPSLHSENIILINPSLNPASQRKVINNVITKTLPVNLGILASVLDKSGINSFRVIDEQINLIDKATLKDMLLSMKTPRIIGMSVLTISSKRAYELAKAIKEIAPDTLVVLGGIHPTVLPEEALSHEGVDIVVRGEGEDTFLELVNAVFSGKDYKGILGLSFKEGSKFKHNPLRPLVDDLDLIPPFPFHLFEKNKDFYSSFSSVVSSRGCPYRCKFCSSRSISGTKYRYHSVERVISEIKLLVDKYGSKMVGFLDDNLAANPKHFMRLLDAIIDSGLNKKACFHASMRADNVNEEILSKAKAANFKLISFGLETGSERLMKLIDKQETVEEVTQAIKSVDRKGMAASTTVIFGLPSETRKDRWDAIKLVRSLPLSSVRFNTLIPYPGTPFFELLSKEGKVNIKDNWENFAVQYMWESDGLAYVPDDTSRYELMFDTMFANFSFYLSLNGVRRMFGSSFAGGNVIILDKSWRALPKTMYKLFRVFICLVLRFTEVSIKMAAQKTRGSKRSHEK